MLELVRLDLVDIDALWQLLADRKIARHMPLHDASVSREWVRRWVQYKCRLWPNPEQGPWGVLQDGELIGWAGFQPEAELAELAVVLTPSAWGVGPEVISLARARWREVGEDREQVVFLPESRNPQRWIHRFGCEYAGRVDLSGVTFLVYKLPEC